MRAFDLTLAATLVGAITALTWGVAAAPSLPAVEGPSRLVKTIRDEGEPCTSGPRLTVGLLAERFQEYDNECVEVGLEVRCTDDCQARLPDGRPVAIRVNTFMSEIRTALQASSSSTVALLGRFKAEPVLSLDVTRVMPPWW